MHPEMVAALRPYKGIQNTPVFKHGAGFKDGELAHTKIIKAPIKKMDAFSFLTLFSLTICTSKTIT
jgi:hypothetical protein